MKIYFLLSLLLACLAHLPTCYCNLRDIIQNNVAGPPLNFQTVSWPFDPDAGKRRRVEYEAVNGRLGWKAVERVGLGEDGRTEERRQQQQLRDSVGGLSYQVPGGYQIS